VKPWYLRWKKESAGLSPDRSGMKLQSFLTAERFTDFEAYAGRLISEQLLD
jgi:hypothetical protein